MKNRIFVVISFLFAIATQSIAQKFIDVYQNDKVIGSMFSSNIDSVSITVTDDSSRYINFWQAGKLTNSFSVNNVDSIKVFRSEDEPLVYLGILGFNQELYFKSIDFLASSTSNLYNKFVDNLPRKDGTLLYYGVEKALDMLTQYKFTTPLSSVNLVTFTDGLDQGSLMMNNKYQDDSEYLSDLSHRINSTSVRGLPLTAYCLGLRGNDVTNYKQFQSNLRQLATSKDKAIEVSSMSDVESRMQEIADQIISISSRQNISMKIPGLSNDTRVRFIFDNKSPESSSMYIEGTFNLADRSLRNITYRGIHAANGNMVEGMQEGIFVTFTFIGLQRSDGNGLIPTDSIKQYNLSKGSSTWQINSEFTPGNNTQTTISHSGAAIMLVLDCSSSLGSQFSNMQNYARNFISHLANNATSFYIYSPTNVKASLDNEMNIDIQWDAVKYAEYYNIFRSNNSNSSFYLVADSIMATTWHDENPLQGANYYRIYALGHGLTSSASNTSEVVRCELAAPTNVIATMNDEMNVNVSWDPVKNAESYAIYRSRYANTGFSKVAENLLVTNWQDKAPQKGANYYRIYAMGHGLTSSPSNTTDVVNYEIASPTNVTATMDKNEWAVNVNWDAVKYAEFYSVSRSNDPSKNFTIVKDGITTNTWHDTAPLQGNNFYRVIAMGHGLTSVASNTSEVVKCELAAPSNVSAIMDTNEWAVNIFWDVVKYAESYSVYRSNNPSKNFTMVVDNLTTTTWRDIAPLQGSNYYRICAKVQGISSHQSSSSEVVICEINAPTNVSAVMEDDEWAVNVNWDKMKYAEYYSVYRSNYPESNYIKVADSLTTTSWRDAEPLNGTNYYRIYAMGHGLTSQASSNYGVVTCEILAPTNVLAVMDENEWAVNVCWDAVKYVDYYSVYRKNDSSSRYSMVADSIKVTNWCDDNPQSGNNYYCIYAYGHGYQAISSSVVVKCEIEAPTSINAIMDNQEWAINISWDAVKHAESYSVYRSNNSSSNFIKIADKLTTTNWQDVEPLNGENYYIIYAMGHGLTSHASSTSEVVYCELSAPNNVTAFLDDDMKVVVNWETVKYAQNYCVYKSKSQSSGFSIVAEGLTATNWKDDSPFYGDAYYRVCAIGHGMTSSASTSVMVIGKYDCPDNKHPHLIDLGLPSGTLWACCNVDSNPTKQSPVNYGGYYAWGETEEKEVYDWSTYIHCNGSSKTCHDLGEDIANTDFDVAHVKWGVEWRMPTIDQYDEIRRECSYKWTTINGVNGGKFTSSNGSSIFLPAAGYRGDNNLKNSGSKGFYCSSTQIRTNINCFNFQSFDSSGVYWGSALRYLGYSVRPVVKK